MWTLVIFLYAGPFSDSDAVAVTNVPGFVSEQTCMAQGAKSKQLVGGTKKGSKFVCLKVSERNVINEYQ